MGFLKNIKGIFNTKALGEAVIEAHLTTYFAFKEAYPGLNEHRLLAKVLVERVKLLAKMNRMPMADENVRMEHAITETALMSVLDPPDSATALGLYSLPKERPDILERHPEFLRQYQRLMKPAMEAHAAGTFADLYAKTNPKIAEAGSDQRSAERSVKLAPADDTLEQGTPSEQRPPSPDISAMKVPLRGFSCGEAFMVFLKDVPSTNREATIPKVVASSFKGRPEMLVAISAQRIFVDKPPYLTFVAFKPEWGVLNGPTEQFLEDDDFFLRQAILQIRQFQGLENTPVIEIDLKNKSYIGVFEI